MKRRMLHPDESLVSPISWCYVVHTDEVYHAGEAGIQVDCFLGESSSTGATVKQPQTRVSFMQAAWSNCVVEQSVTILSRNG